MCDTSTRRCVGVFFGARVLTRLYKICYIYMYVKRRGPRPASPTTALWFAVLYAAYKWTHGSKPRKGVAMIGSFFLSFVILSADVVATPDLPMVAVGSADVAVTPDLPISLMVGRDPTTGQRVSLGVTPEQHRRQSDAHAIRGEGGTVYYPCQPGRSIYSDGWTGLKTGFQPGGKCWHLGSPLGARPPR